MLSPFFKPSQEGQNKFWFYLTMYINHCVIAMCRWKAHKTWPFLAGLNIFYLLSNISKSSIHFNFLLRFYYYDCSHRVYVLAIDCLDRINKNISNKWAVLWLMYDRYRIFLKRSRVWIPQMYGKNVATTVLANNTEGSLYHSLSFLSTELRNTFILILLYLFCLFSFN